MPALDKSRIAYRHNGHTVRLAAPRVPAPLDLDVAMIGGRTYATITTNSTGVYDLTATTWGADPPVGPYSQTRMTGPEAVYVPSGQSTRITARVPFLGGGFRSISTDVITGSVGYLPDVQMHTIVRGPIDVPIETQRGFTTARTCPARLWRTATGTLGTSTPERTLIHEAQVTFPAGEAVKLTHPVTHPAATGYGAGYEYEWEVEVQEGHTISSRPLAIWVIGDAPECAPPDPDTVPTFKVPDIYRRPATSYGQVTPPAGKTYQDCLNALQNQWKGTGTANLPGAWINFNQYNMAAIFVDLDDPTVPRYDIEHLDYRNWGYTPPGWYGTDTNTEPWPRSNIARDVPIPHNARVSHGTDRSITIVGMRGGQIERIWEMWIAGRRADGTWTSETLGVTTPAERYQHSRAYTVTASGICHMTGSLMLGETKRAVDYIRTERAAGRTPSKSHIVSIIDHPLGVAMPNPRDGVISYPATFTDGTNPDPATPAEGQMIYLRPDLDIDALGLTPLKYAIAVVMQARGCYVTDRTNWNTSLMVEGDITYTGDEWAAVRDPGEDWYIVYPDDAWVIGKVYPDQASFDADTPAGTAAVPYEMWVDGSNRYGLTTEFTGGGVATPNSDGTITYAPAWANGSETRAVLIRSDQEWMGDVTIDARIATLEQRPTGANPWEVGWLMWNYTRASSSTPTQGVGNTDLWARKCYYFALKPNGWELGKLDQENLTGSGGQRFLATGSTPTYPIGSVHDVRITQTGTTITVTVDGQQLTQTTDSSDTYPWVAGESAYTSGAVAMYCEDAKVKVSRLSVTQSASPTVVVPLDAAAEPVALPSYDDTVIADGPSMFLRDGAADVVNTSRSVSTFGATATAANLPGGGKSLVFPGTSGAYVQVPSTPDVQCAALGALTVEAWITRAPGDLSIGEDDGSGEGIKVNFAGVLWYDTVNRVQWEWRTYKEKLANGAAAPRAKRWSAYMFAPNGGLGTGSYYQEGVGTMQPLPDGVPFHLVAVYDDTQAMRDKTNGWGRVTQYINGVQVDTDPFSNYQTRPALVDAPLRIGTSDGWSWFAGAVGKFATYKRALTAAEVADHYAAMIRAAV